MNPDPDRRARQVEPAWLRDLVLRAGAVLVEASMRRSDVRVDHKGRVDLVTGTDFAIQELILREIGDAYPGEPVVAEEADADAPVADGPVWYVDPLDGTTNFVHGHPFCAVSVARWNAGEPEVGAVHAPLLDELFLATSGHGAWLERPRAGEPRVRLGCSDCNSLDEALLATGFPYHRGATARLNLAICAHALTRVRGLRRGGSAALDLCHVALGRLDGYWEMGLHSWDLAAAALVAREAGARVTDFEGSGSILEGRRVVAAAPDLHPQLLRMIEDAHRRPELDVLGPLPGTPLPLSGPLPTELT